MRNSRKWKGLLAIILATATVFGTPVGVFAEGSSTDETMISPTNGESTESENVIEIDDSFDSEEQTSNKIKRIMISDGVKQVKSIQLAIIVSSNKILNVQTDQAASGFTQFECASSKKSVATVTQQGDKISITAVRPGNAKITVKATDGSKKKTSIKVKVIHPAIEVEIENKKYRGRSMEYTPNAFHQEYPINPGAKMKLTAKADKNATIKKAKWTNVTSPYFTFKNGVLVCKKNAPIGTKITLRADATDGCGAFHTRTYVVKPPITSIELSNKKIVLSRYGVQKINIKMGPEFTGVSAYSRNKKIADYMTGYDSSGLNFTVHGARKGSTQIVFQAVDGSNKKAVLNVLVK